jgi:hypothetical protein
MQGYLALSTEANVTAGDVDSDWPPLPELSPADPQTEVKKIRYQAEIQAFLSARQAEAEAQNAEQTADIERQKAAWAAEYVFAQSVHSAYMDVAKAAVERSRSNAELVQKAAAAISSAYAAVLALSFTMSGDKRVALPARGVAPTLFLGLSIVLATSYVAFLKNGDSQPDAESSPMLNVWQMNRRNRFIEWVSDYVHARAHLLRGAVISLGLGVFFLPLPYLDIPTWCAVVAVLLGVVAVIAVSRRAERGPKSAHTSHSELQPRKVDVASHIT